MHDWGWVGHLGLWDELLSIGGPLSMDWLRGMKDLVLKDGLMVTSDSVLRDGLDMTGDSVDVGAVMMNGDAKSALAVDMENCVVSVLCRCRRKFGNSKK
jgi:hypothetical protein